MADKKIVLNPTKDGEYRASSQNGKLKSFGPDKGWALYNFMLECGEVFTGVEIDEQDEEVEGEV